LDKIDEELKDATKNDLERKEIEELQKKQQKLRDVINDKIKASEVFNEVMQDPSALGELGYTVQEDGTVKNPEGKTLKTKQDVLDDLSLREAVEVNDEKLQERIEEIKEKYEQSKKTVNEVYGESNKLSS